MLCQLLKNLIMKAHEPSHRRGEGGGGRIDAVCVPRQPWSPAHVTQQIEEKGNKIDTQTHKTLRHRTRARGARNEERRKRQE
ncbi:hypothetical protein ABEB36_006196 [Hypothenemus hampei]|uniref:Uncharacterized protein n=1 Tax=Hypothenemus hampei TaxID=57062 RepID=A0ABD1EQ42_HYPHA